MFADFVINLILLIFPLWRVHWYHLIFFVSPAKMNPKKIATIWIIKPYKMAVMHLKIKSSEWRFRASPEAKAEKSYPLVHDFQKVKTKNDLCSRSEDLCSKLWVINSVPRKSVDTFEQFVQLFVWIWIWLTLEDLADGVNGKS